MAVKTHIKIINKQSGDYLLNIYSLYSRYIVALEGLDLNKKNLV